MKTLDLNEMKVQELDRMETLAAGWQVELGVELALKWIGFCEEYVRYSMKTGGKYVVHHV